MAQSMHGGASLAVREPVRMDVAYHGARPIIVEFAAATVLLVGLSALQFVLALTRADAATHWQWTAIFGVWALNALTFMLLAREGARSGTIPPREHFTHWSIFVATVESLLLLLLPLVFPVLALIQRPHR
jgi:hypothetical protein